MSRSHRKSPVVSRSTNDKWEWWFKRRAHKRMRHQIKQALHTGQWEDLPIHYREVSNVYDWPKDGKQHFWYYWEQKWCRRTYEEWLEMREYILRRK